MDINRKNRLYSLVVMDLTSHCNHRCRFCYNIWGEESSMQWDTFQKVLQILPYTQDKHVALSCKYEPSLNPLFFEMVAQIPRQYKNKVCLTTNLDGNYTDAELETLAQSHLHHVEVSLPSLEKERYCQITGSETAICLDNLRRLRQAIDRNANRTRLQLTTMVVKSNYKEILTLVQRAHEELRPYAHVLNTPQIFEESENVLLQGEKDNSRTEMELLSRAELDELQEALMGLGYKNLIYSLGFDAGSYAAKKAGRAIAPAVHDAYSIYIGPDGQGFFMMDENPFDLADIDHPFVFFSQALMARQSHQAAINEVHNPPAAHDHSEDLDFHAMLDKVTIWDERFVQLQGWGFHKQVAPGPLYIVLKTQEAEMVYLAQNTARPDVASEYENDDYANCGFDCMVDPKVLPYVQGQSYEVYLAVAHAGGLFTKKLTELSF